MIGTRCSSLLHRVGEPLRSGAKGAASTCGESKYQTAACRRVVFRVRRRDGTAAAVRFSRTRTAAAVRRCRILTARPSPSAQTGAFTTAQTKGGDEPKQEPCGRIPCSCLCLKSARGPGSPGSRASPRCPLRLSAPVAPPVVPPRWSLRSSCPLLGGRTRTRTRTRRR